MAGPDLIIHINGWPGCGKLTIGRELAKRLGARLLDKHTIIKAMMVSGTILISADAQTGCQGRGPRRHYTFDRGLGLDDRLQHGRHRRSRSAGPWLRGDRSRLTAPPVPVSRARRGIPHRTPDNHLAPNWRCTAQNSACFESKRSEIAFDRNMAWVDCRRRKPLVALHSNRIPHASASCRRRERELVRGVRRRQWKYSSSSSSTG